MTGHSIYLSRDVHADMVERARWSRGDPQWRGIWVEAITRCRPWITQDREIMSGGYISSYYAIAALPWNRNRRPK